MAGPAWDCVLDKCLLPRGGLGTGDATVNSSPVTVPKGAHAMTVHFPTNSTTFTIQTLTPPRDDQEAEAWKTISAATGVTLVPLTSITASAIAVTWTLANTGGGVLRFVAAADQSGGPLTIWVVFHMQP